jgi:hypothetical protein
MHYRTNSIALGEGIFFNNRIGPECRDLRRFSTLPDPAAESSSWNVPRFIPNPASIYLQKTASIVLVLTKTL